MLLYQHETKSTGNNPLMSVVCRILERLFIIPEDSFFVKLVDRASRGHIEENPIICSAFGCFEKENMCCKSCDIKSCRYKCNFIDKAVCKHQLYG